MSANISHPSAKGELKSIALLAALYGFQVRCVPVAEEDNPADAPSKGRCVAVSHLDWTFVYSAAPAFIDAWQQFAMGSFTERISIVRTSDSVHSNHSFYILSYIMDAGALKGFA